MSTRDELRENAKTLPEVEEDMHFRLPPFRVRGSVFANRTTTRCCTSMPKRLTQQKGHQESRRPTGVRHLSACGSTCRR
jgi:hypothetical protein